MELNEPDSLALKKRPIFTIALFVLLGIWLVLLLAVASWYQSNYIISYTDKTPLLLDTHETDAWLQQLNTQLPPIKASGRIIQLWRPDCLCNRFARPHAIAAVDLAQKQGLEHITLIPMAFADRVVELAQLNPNTKIIPIAPQSLPFWPNAPTAIYQTALGELMYFGPLGFGAFCSQSSASAIEQQVANAKQGNSNPFYNVLGKGCFCPWND